MERPTDLPEPVWDRAIELTQQLEGDEGTTHHEFWRRVELIARSLWMERHDSAEIARGFHGGEAIAKAIKYDGRWDAYGFVPATPPAPEGLANGYDPKTGLVRKPGQL